MSELELDSLQPSAVKSSLPHTRGSSKASKVAKPKAKKKGNKHNNDVSYILELEEE
jgi:hypothetical protein